MIPPRTLPTPVTMRAVILFAKNPLPGFVKTRLSPPLSPETAAGLYRCMLLDSLALVLSLNGITPFLFFQDDPGAAEYFASLAPEIITAPQKGKDLGERMKNAFRELFNQGFRQIAIIGTDSPDLPPKHVYEAFDLLDYEHTDVVFGPAEDGGYYLMALKKVWKELFSGLPWSSELLLAASVEKAKDYCLGVSFLPQWHDIDTAADLERATLLDETSPAKKTREFLISEHQPGNRHSSDR